MDIVSNLKDTIRFKPFRFCIAITMNATDYGYQLCTHDIHRIDRYCHKCKAFIPKVQYILQDEKESNGIVIEVSQRMTNKIDDSCARIKFVLVEFLLLVFKSISI